MTVLNGWLTVVKNAMYGDAITTLSHVAIDPEEI